MVHTDDSHKHRRRSIRLREWDYTGSGIYFVTICTRRRQNLFDNTQFNEVAANAWSYIPHQPHAPHVTLDEWVIMPNHLHAIIIMIADGDGVDETEHGPVARSLQNATAGSLGVVIGNYKSLVTRRINNLRWIPGGQVWQRGYYEQIIRHERALNAIRKYIRDNPIRWAEDRENLDRLLAKMRLML